MRCYCVTHHAQPLALIEQAMPTPQGSEVVLAVNAAGVCHTDLHLWEGFYDLGGGRKLVLADQGIAPPMVLSHEIAGTVAACGPDVADAATLLGRQVLVYPWIGCGACAYCARGEEHLCPQSKPIGVGRPGGFAEAVLVPHPRYLIDLEGVSAAQAAPLACAGVTTFSALKKFGERLHTGPVVVIGAGGLGLMAIAVVKALGGQGVIVADIDAGKREAALAAGALQAIDATAPDAAKQIVKSTQGGARATLDLVGAPPTVTLAMRGAARGGQIVMCGLMGGELMLSLPMIPMRPITLQGSYVGSLAELRELLALVQQGRLALPAVQTRPLDEANAALQDLAQGRVAGRVVLVP